MHLLGLPGTMQRSLILSLRSEDCQDTSMAIKTKDTEVLGIFKELNSYKNKFSDKFEKLSPKVYFIYERNDNGYANNQSEDWHKMSNLQFDQDFENYAHG